MTYRTRTYIAGDWTGDKDAIDQLHKWNDSKYWGLNFTDAHDLHQSYDNSLNCSIKSSLCQRMNASKTFVLIVGNKTNSLTAGSCKHCTSYYGYFGTCYRGHSVSLKSYREYDCDKAVRYRLNIVVLYNSTIINKFLCPTVIRDKGIHIPMKDMFGSWNYQNVKNAIDEATK